MKKTHQVALFRAKEDAKEEQRIHTGRIDDALLDLATQLIVALTQLRIAEDAIGICQLLETLLRLLLCLLTGIYGPFLWDIDSST